ncbi:MAG: hypothetical protein EOM20_03330 [Spartobacteria bacterium]|nr:hypothetical protein [Spartobacteria bacterium]
MKNVLIIALLGLCVVVATAFDYVSPTTSDSMLRGDVWMSISNLTTSGDFVTTNGIECATLTASSNVVINGGDLTLTNGNLIIYGAEITGLNTQGE